MITIRAIWQADWGHALQKAANRVAPFIAAFVVCAQLAYWLGRQTRTILDITSETFAAFFAVATGVARDDHYEMIDQFMDLLFPVERLIEEPMTAVVIAVAAPPKTPASPKGRPAPVRPKKQALKQS